MTELASSVAMAGFRGVTSVRQQPLRATYLAAPATAHPTFLTAGDRPGRTGDDPVAQDGGWGRARPRRLMGGVDPDTTYTRQGWGRERRNTAGYPTFEATSGLAEFGRQAPVGVVRHTGSGSAARPAQPGSRHCASRVLSAGTGKCGSRRIRLPRRVLINPCFNTGLLKLQPVTRRVFLACG